MQTKISPAIELKGISKIYGDHKARALSAVDLTIELGEFVAIMGPSGCGKTTLLNLIGGIDRPSEGTIMIEGFSLAKLNDEDLTKIRRTNVGFIFQFFNLLSTLTVAENVALPLELNRSAGRQAISERVSAILQKVGMSERASFYPAELSGGEMQRTAIARALVHKPRLLVADEPTGNLDSENGQKVLQLLKSFASDEKQTIVMATHSLEAASCCDRIVQMKDGLITGESKS